MKDRTRAEINCRISIEWVGGMGGYYYACQMHESWNGFAKSLSTLPNRWMSEAADAGPRLKRDRWDAAGLRRSRKRVACRSAPFALESRNLQRATPFLPGDNVGRERGGDPERMSSLRWLAHWSR